MPSVEGVDNDVVPTGYGVHGRSDRGGYGVVGDSTSGTKSGVSGTGTYGSGVSGFSTYGSGVSGESTHNYGVYGTSPNNVGVHGSSNSSYGVSGLSWSNTGVSGISNTGSGVSGSSTGGVGASGTSASNTGVYGTSTLGSGVSGSSTDGVGVSGSSGSNTGVSGSSGSNTGVSGSSTDGVGVSGSSNSNTAVSGWSDSGTGVHGRSNSGLAAYLEGNVEITGNLTKGGGSFKIDHPLDPANKYLHHSFVESPDMKNVYDGVVVLDDMGEAEIELPDWFGALNKDFRYQLTAIGAPGPNLYIAEEISDKTTNYTSNNKNSRFKIAGGTSIMKVSWQVTGIRKDPWAIAHRIQVEEEKPDKERGYYLYPDLYSQPEENGISHLLFPKDKREELARAFHK